jgi:hypothetical protein
MVGMPVTTIMVTGKGYIVVQGHGLMQDITFLTLMVYLPMASFSNHSRAEKIIQ